MNIVLYYFILGFLGHFIILFIDENELKDFQQLTFKKKLNSLTLNTALGIFSFIFSIYYVFFIIRMDYKKRKEE